MSSSIHPVTPTTVGGRLLVTGGAGYIGSHVVYAALAAGYEVVVLDDLSAGVAANLPADVRLVVGDVGDAALVSGLLRDVRPDGVIHLAGLVSVAESMEQPARYYRVNTASSLVLFEARATQGVGHVVFSSSAAVCGLPEASRIPETAVLNPINPYGRSKLMAEQLLADVARASGMRYALLRYFNVAGADAAGRTGQSSPQVTHLIRIACQVAVGKRDRMAVFGKDYATPDGSCIRDYLHVSDLAAAHIGVFEHIRGTGRSVCYNCGNGQGFSVLEVIAAVEAVSGRRIPVDVLGRRAGDPAIPVADPTLIADEIGWSPSHAGLNDMISSALAWERRTVRA